MANENMYGDAVAQNNSGMGSNSPVPEVVSKRFNWGAFFLSWIWGLGNKTYITLIVFAVGVLNLIPFLGLIVGLGVAIWFGIKGNEWAWQNKQWESVEHFHSVQKKWATAGVVVHVILYAILIPAIVATMMLPLFVDTSSSQIRTNKLKAVAELSNATRINEAMERKCKLSSSGLAKCFAEHLSGERTKNVIDDGFGTVYTFKGDKVCANKGDCKVKIELSARNGNSEVIEIPILVNEKGFVSFDSQDLEAYKN